MKKNLLTLSAIALCIAISSCGGKESAKSVAQKWCDLNGKVAKAADGGDKDAAKAARTKYETDMAAKHKDDKAFMEEVGKEVEKCEAASEGK